jgi:hypothetical protein
MDYTKGANREKRTYNSQTSSNIGIFIKLEWQ